MAKGNRVGILTFILMAAFCLSGALYAADSDQTLRLGMYQVTSDAVPAESVDWIVDLITERFTFKNDILESETEFINGNNTSLEISKAQADAHTVWQGEDAAKISAISRSLDVPVASATFPIGLPIEYVRIQSNPALDGLFAHTNTEFLSILGTREQLAGVIVIWPSLMGNLLRLRIVYHDLIDDTSRIMFDRLVPLRDVQDLQEDILLALLPLSFGDDVALLHIENSVPGLAVSLDGVDYPIFENQIAVPSGENMLELSAFGYESKSVPISVEAGTRFIVDANLEQSGFGPLSIASEMGEVDWFLDGVRQEGLPFLFPDQNLPINVIASREGFMSSSIQSTTPVRQIVFDLKPEWMTDENLITRNRDTFYSAMGKALGAFGLWVGLQSMAATFSDTGVKDPKWQPWVFLTGGVAVVSVVDLIGGLLAYYTGTRYSTP